MTTALTSSQQARPQHSNTLKESSASELYQAFLAPGFNANEYANLLLARDSSAGPSASSTTNGNDALALSSDVGPAMARLNGGIDELHRRLRSQIHTHHSDLLGQASNLSTLQDALSKLTTGLTQVDSGVDRLRNKIAQPYTQLDSLLERHDRLCGASDLARRVQRVVLLSKRLQVQMTSLRQEEREEARRTALVDAAATCEDLDALVSLQEEEQDQQDLSSISALEQHLAAIDQHKLDLTQRMHDLLTSAFEQSNQQGLAASLQAAHHLKLLAPVVADLIRDILVALEQRIRHVFDMAALSRDMNKDPSQSQPPSAFGYRSRNRTEPTNTSAPAWRAALWKNLEQATDSMANTCIKVHVLEKVLKDPATAKEGGGRSYLDVCLAEDGLDNRPGFMFWTSTAKSFEKSAQDACKSSQFLQQTLGSQGYTKLLRLFLDFLGRIALHTDTVYTRNHQSPETVLLLRAIQPFERLYLERSTSKMNEAVAEALKGGVRSPPGATEGLAASRVLSNELDAVRFDPLLVRTVAKNVAKAMDSFGSRIDGLVAGDLSAVSVIGPQSTPSQSLNAELANAIYYFWTPFRHIINNSSDYPADSGVPEALSPPANNLRKELFSITAPLLSAIRKDFTSILSRMHSVNFTAPSSMEAGSSSPYLSDLSDKLGFVRLQLLRPLKLGEMSREWATDLARFLVREFMLHASIVRPLGEEGKLRLVSDLTSLEFAISQLLSDNKLSLSALGDDFTSMRALRPLLFIDTSELASPQQTASIPTLVLCHHIIVRSPESLKLPHELHGWRETEYVRWVNEHEVDEQLKLVRRSLDDWRAGTQETETDDPVQPYADVLEQVLSRDSN